MYEVINVVTKKSEGIFVSCRAAEKWIREHGDPEDFRILPW